MPKISYINHTFSASSMSLLMQTDQIMVEYAKQGYKLTLRQLYYQMIARDLFPEDWIDPETGSKNNMRSYKKFGDLVNNGRLAGYLDWDFIEDRARETVFPATWTSPAEIIQACSNQYRLDKWENQGVHFEVMAEKDAVSGILVPVCRELQVRFTANRGYASSSLFYEVSNRLIGKINSGNRVLILYLGDHDPSGIDMTRDITSRIAMFTGEKVKVKRLALNIDQVNRWNPPPNPAKEKDSRFGSYQEMYGNESWELDAIEPSELAKLVRDEVLAYRDDDLWNEMNERENTARLKLSKIAFNLERED